VSENVYPYYALIVYMHEEKKAIEFCLESMDRRHAVGHYINKLIPDLDVIYIRKNAPMDRHGYRYPVQNPRTSCTVLHYIADNFQRIEVLALQKLLELGADPNIPDGK
jgi:hypothetical protein